MGLLRNLTAGEIAAQVRVMAHDLDLASRRFNIVLMGMGELLHNYDETMKALRILAAECGLAVGPRRVTLSTVGVLPALERLAQEPLMPNLAVSLHATNEELRDRLVPVSRKYGLADLIAACRRFPLARRDRITFEYVLLRDVNDGVADARRLANLLRHPLEGQRDPAQRGARHPVPPAVRCAGGPLCTHAGRAARDGVGAQEPRARHPRRLRAAHRRGGAAGAGTAGGRPAGFVAECEFVEA